MSNKSKRRLAQRYDKSNVVVIALDVCDADRAKALHKYMGLQPSLVGQNLDSGQIFSLYQTPRPINSCVAMVDGDRLLAITHGSDCGISTYMKSQLGACGEFVDAEGLAFCARTRLFGVDWLPRVEVSNIYYKLQAGANTTP